MKKRLLAAVASMLVLSGPVWACCAEELCGNGKYIFCCTLTGSCITGTFCGGGGGQVCCSERDSCTGEIDTFCDGCVPES